MAFSYCVGQLQQNENMYNKIIVLINVHLQFNFLIYYNNEILLDKQRSTSLLRHRDGGEEAEER